MKSIFTTALLVIAVTSQSYGITLNVGIGQTYSNPTQAAAVANPGDTILIHPGNYLGTFFINNLNGSPNAPIVIKGMNKKTVIMNGGSEGLHFSEVSYIKIQDITFTAQTGNSLNIDDAGTINTPAHNVTVTNCDFKYMGAQGNNDFLKISGLDAFEISYCSFLKAAAGGSGIDMVGCHNGIVHHCQFDSMGSNSVQMKGGTRFIKIENNLFRNGGQRALNLGGSTGLTFFRPPDAGYEAADITVYANVFIKSQAPIAFVGSERVDVSNNTIYMPEKWVIRILQETVDTSRFVPCSNGMFRNNIIYYSNVVTTHVNVGPNTAPSTFLFSHNLWYNSSNPANSTPILPTSETSAITGQDPVFTAADDFTLKSTSPAIGSGTNISTLPTDMKGSAFKNPPSRGAYEFGSSSSVSRSITQRDVMLYPNPASSGFCILSPPSKMSCTVMNSTGQIVLVKEISDADACILLEDVPAGICQAVFCFEDGSVTVKSFLKL